jgi:hypothetical protein
MTTATTDAPEASGEISIYRAEALRHHGGLLAEDAVLLLEVPRWVGRVFWLLVISVAALALAAAAWTRSAP